MSEPIQNGYNSNFTMDNSPSEHEEYSETLIDTRHWSSSLPEQQTHKKKETKPNPAENYVKQTSKKETTTANKQKQSNKQNAKTNKKQANEHKQNKTKQNKTEQKQTKQNKQNTQTHKR